MNADLEARVAFLEGKVEALTQLLLCHIASVDLHVRGSATGTLDRLQDQMRAALDGQAPRAGIVMADLDDNIRAALDLPVNS